MVTFLAHHGAIAVPLSIALIIAYTYLALRLGYSWGVRELDFRKLNFGPNALAQNPGAHARRKKAGARPRTVLAPALAALRLAFSFKWLRSFIAGARDYLSSLNADDAPGDDIQATDSAEDEIADLMDKADRIFAGECADD